MLIQKKISNKKLGFYMAVIVLMVFGTLLLIQKNNGLKKRKSAPVVMEVSREVDIKINNPSIDSADKNVKTEENVTPVGDEKMKILNSNKILDLSILFDEKFKKLKEPIIKSIDFKVGNKDLFISIN